MPGNELPAEETIGDVDPALLLALEEYVLAESEPDVAMDRLIWVQVGSGFVHADSGTYARAIQNISAERPLILGGASLLDAVRALGAGERPMDAIDILENVQLTALDDLLQEWTDLLGDDEKLLGHLIRVHRVQIADPATVSGDDLLGLHSDLHRGRLAHTESEGSPRSS